MWSGFYPQKNQLNMSYVKVMQEIVDGFAKQGMYVLLDMHQDVISTRFEAYDGVPRWLIDQFPRVAKEVEFPWPLNASGKDLNWFENYLTYEVGDTFQKLYDNSTGSLTYWAQFWTKVAENFGSRGNVIGYELINEPWAGNIYLNPLRLIPGYAGRHNLLPVYDYLIQEIRKVDTQTLVFYEPVTWGYYFPGGGYQGTGFNRIPGGDKERSRSVMSYHYYCWLLQTMSPDRPYPHWDRLICDDIFAESVFRSAREDQRIFKMGLFMTEFGACEPNRNKSETIDTIECVVMLNLLDDYLQSWAYWGVEFFNTTTGEPLWEMLTYFSRAYPRATAGQPTRLTFNHETSEMVYAFEFNETIDAPTEIFLPLAIHYGGSAKNVNVTVSPPNLLDVRVDVESSTLILTKRTTYQREFYSKNNSVEVRVSKVKRYY
jgi:endoglycosylceramidase